MIFFLLAFSLYVSAETCEAMKPVVFIHGIIAGMLEGEVNVAADTPVAFDPDCDYTYKYTRLWVALKDFNPFVNECILGYLTPMYDIDKNQQYDPKGITIISPEFGSTYACDQIDPNFPVSLFAECFHDLIEKLKKCGYVDADNMVAASYDWRYYRFDEYEPHKENWFTKAADLIKTTHSKHGKVVIISHSMGCLMTYKLLSIYGQSFADTYIDNWVAMSGPFIGAGEAIAAVFPGYNMGLPLTAKKVRPFARHVETVALLLPVGGNAVWGSEPILTVTSTGKKYYADDLDELLDTVDDDSFKANFHHVVSHGMKELLNKHNHKFPVTMEVNCLVTTGVETISGVTMATPDYDGDHSFVYGDGDGTVNIQSLEYCKKMGSTTYQNLGKESHTGILKSKVSWEAVKAFVC